MSRRNPRVQQPNPSELQSEERPGKRSRSASNSTQRKDCSPATSCSVYASLLHIARIHQERGNFAEAYVKYRQAYTVQLDALGANDLEVATTLSKMGFMKFQLKMYESAFDLYQAALGVQRDSLGSDDHLDIAATLNMIGLVLFPQRDYQLAKDCFCDSLRIRIKILGSDHKDVAILWYNLGTLHVETGRDDQAISCYREAIRVEKLSEKPEDVVLTLQHLGLFYQKIGDLKHALKCFVEAVEILQLKRRHGGETEGSLIGKLLNLIGNIHLQTANVSEMMDCFTQATRIHQRNGRPSASLVIAGYNFYGLSKLHPPSAPMA